MAWVPNISLSNDFTNEFREIAARRSDQLNERVENRQGARMDDRTDLAFLLTSFATTGAPKEAKSVQDGDVSPALTAQTSCVSEDEQVKEYSLDSAREYPSDNEDKHLKRMKRNRESAALSRSRKKQYVEELLAKVQELDATVHALQTENAQLKRECASLAPAAPADLPASSTVGEQGPSSERSMAPSSPLADDSERGCSSPNTRRAAHPARSISPTRAGCLALLKMTTGSSTAASAAASSHCTALPVC